MTEGVIARTAEHRASLSIVMLVTHESVGILQLCPSACLQVLEPLLPNRQVSLGGHTADQALGVV